MVGRWSRGFMGEAMFKVGFELAHKIKKGILPNKRFCLSKTLDTKITTLQLMVLSFLSKKQES